MRKITYNKLVAQNFLSIGNDSVEIDFHGGFNMITGNNVDNPERRNGAGKSAVIEAFYYALFGTTLRKIRKEFVANNVTRGKGSVELWFDVHTDNSVTSYKIVRQLKPSTAQLWILGTDEKDISKDSIANTNKYICELIGSNPVICKSCDILSLSDNVPFMAKEPEDKRKFVEDIFSLEVFGKMMKDLKDLIKENNKEMSVVTAKIEEVSNSISVLREQYDVQKKKNDERDEVFRARKDDILRKIKETRNEMDSIVIPDLEKVSDELAKYQRANDIIDNKVSVLSASIAESNFRISELQKKLRRTREIDGAECDKCMQKIGDSHIQHVREMAKDFETRIEKEQNDLADLGKERSDLVQKLGKCAQKIREFEKVLEKAENDKRKQQTLAAIISEYERGLETLEKDMETNNDTLSVFQANIDNAEARKKEHDDVFEELKQKSDDYETAKFVLGEEGVKSFIIKNLLDMLNASIQKYITDLGMSMRCKFDEYFDEKITNDKGTEVSYWNFSGGERKTVDIACSWAFKDIKRKISGVSSNVEFLDEILDSAFDERGLDLLIDVMKDRIEKHSISCYAISHRKEMTKHVDGETVNLEKENGITRRVLGNS